MTLSLSSDLCYCSFGPHHSAPCQPETLPRNNVLYSHHDARIPNQGGYNCDLRSALTLQLPHLSVAADVNTLWVCAISALQVSPRAVFHHKQSLSVVIWSSYLVKGVLISESLYLERPKIKDRWVSLVTMDSDGKNNRRHF